jgi:predicted nuclease of predicted toxin-antitoxin system
VIFRFIVDEQLSPDLATRLSSAGLECVHVIQLIGREAPDKNIWTYAYENGWGIISKDEDFANLHILAKGPPNLIWIRLGNCRNGYLIPRMVAHVPRLIRLLERGDRLIEIL